MSEKTSKNQTNSPDFEENSPDTDSPLAQAPLQDVLRPVSEAESAALRAASAASVRVAAEGIPAGGAPLFDPLKAKRGFDKPVAAIALDGMKVSELLELRAEIDKRLPARKLADIDLEEELLMQFARTREFYDDIISDDATPANQRAQVANSCSAILEQLIKMQLKLYGAERVKAIELTVIRVLKELPAETQARFFELYEKALEAAQAEAA